MDTERARASRHNSDFRLIGNLSARREEWTSRWEKLIHKHHAREREKWRKKERWNNNVDRMQFSFCHCHILCTKFITRRYLARGCCCRCHIVAAMPSKGTINNKYRLCVVHAAGKDKAESRALKYSSKVRIKMFVILLSASMRAGKRAGPSRGE
jgi:hypothetical protein